MLSSPQDEREITALAHRYATGIDRKDFELFRSCWADEINCDYGNGQAWKTGDAITSFMKIFHSNMPHTLHRIMNIVLEDAESGVVTGRTYVHGLLMGEEGKMLLDTSGYYDDVFHLHGSEWKIVKRNYTNVFSFGPLLDPETLKAVNAKANS